MTRDEILNMPAGREMDALIFQHVLDSGTNFDSFSWRDGYGYEQTFYSTDIAAAWQVVEKFSTDPMLCNDVDIITTIRGWKCAIRTNKRDIISNAETAPLAICRAALLAVME